PPDQPEDPEGPESGRPRLGGRLRRARRGGGPRRDPGPRPVVQPDVRPLARDAAGGPAFGADPGPRPARGRPGPSAPELAHRGPAERPVAWEAPPAPRGRSEPGGRAEATGDDRGAGPRAVVARPRGGEAVRGLRPPGVARGRRAAGRPLLPACEGRAPVPR